MNDAHSVRAVGDAGARAPGAVLTEAQRAALEYTSFTMGAYVSSIGRHVIRLGLVKGGGYQAVGTGIVGTLRKLGLVCKTECGWRLTETGRALMAQERDAPGPREDCPACSGTGRFEGKFSGPGWPDCPECQGAGKVGGRPTSFLLDAAMGEEIARLRASEEEWRKANLGIVRKCAEVEQENARLRAKVGTSKIVQIACCAMPETADIAGGLYLYALCEDGTLWVTDRWSSPWEDWKRIHSIPSASGARAQTDPPQDPIARHK
jgi:hypothetical protein